MRKLPFFVLIILVAVPCAISKSSQSPDETGLYIFDQELSNDNIHTSTRQSTINVDGLLKNIEMFKLDMVKDVDLLENIKLQKSPVNINYRNENYDHITNEDILREAHPYRMLRKRKKIYFPFLYHKGGGKTAEKRNQKNKLICFNCHKDLDESRLKVVTSEPRAYGSENLFGYVHNDKTTIANEHEMKPLYEFNHMSTTQQNIFLASEPNVYDSAYENNGNIKEPVLRERSLEQENLEDEKKSEYTLDRADEFKKLNDNLEKNLLKDSDDATSIKTLLVKMRDENQGSAESPDARGDQRLLELEEVQRRISAHDVVKEPVSESRVSERPNIIFSGGFTLF